jgi:hypothetical protein
MTSYREMFVGFGDAGLEGDELKVIVLVPTRETAMLALDILHLDHKGATIPRIRGTST